MNVREHEHEFSDQEDITRVSEQMLYRWAPEKEKATELYAEEVFWQERS